MAFEGVSKAESVQHRHLAQIDKLYCAVERRLGSDRLDQLLMKLDLETLGPILEGYFIELSNSGLESGAGAGANEAWRTAISFVRSTILRIGHAGAAERLDRLHARVVQLDSLYKQLQPRRECKAPAPRALPAAVLEDLYDIVDPTSTRNPFRGKRNAFRNFTLVSLMLHQGLRRGEACILPVDAIKDGIDPKTGVVRYWINITKNPYETSDTRSLKPSLKTPDAHRKIPISDELAVVVETYIQNFRGTQDHSFLFPSQKGRALSLGMVNLVFRILSENLSAGAKKELWERRNRNSVTPHDLRHTAAVVRLTEFLDAGETMEVALDKLKIFFGWTKNSEMPRHYARAYFEERLSSVWNSRFDAHVDRLRRLEESSAS
jgi:integrase